MLALLIFGVALLVIGAVTKISDYPNVATPATNDLFILASGATNKNIRYDQLKTAINAGVSSTNVTNEVINSTTINVTTQNFYLAKGARVIITNDLLFNWATLTLSGTNVSAVNLTNASLFKLTLTTNGFLPEPINFPGTNQGAVFQLHIAQDGTGSRSLTATNSAWVLSGSGTSTNAVLALNTNANAVTVLTFATSPFNATKVYGVVTPF